MAAREGSYRVFACFLNVIYQFAEQSAHLGMNEFTMCGEVMTQVRVVPFACCIKSYRLEVVVRTCNGEELEYEVVDEERAEEDNNLAL